MATPEIDLTNIVTSSRYIDLTALGQIFDTYSAQIYRYILFRIGGASEAQETLSEVFDHLLQTIFQRPKSIDYLQSWLFETARTLVEQNLHDANLVSQNSEPEQHTDGAAPVTRAPQDQTIWLGFLVRRSIQRLLPDHQHLLTLRFAGHYTPDEIARIMDKSINDIKIIQLEALAALRDQLERES